MGGGQCNEEGGGGGGGERKPGKERGATVSRKDGVNDFGEMGTSGDSKGRQKSNAKVYFFSSLLIVADVRKTPAKRPHLSQWPETARPTDQAAASTSDFLGMKCAVAWNVRGERLKCLIARFRSHQEPWTEGSPF